jgi:predicted DNA-binding helix-hairpin-helix protein
LSLSSGIVPDADTTMEKMLATVERLRLKERYTRYIHLKLIPGASFEYIERVVELADRVSLNLEAPNQARLAQIAPDKEFAGSMWGRLAWAAELMKRARREGRQAAPILTTQFVVGAVGRVTASCWRQYSGRTASWGCGGPTSAPSTPSSARRRQTSRPKIPRVRCDSTSLTL